MSTLEKAIKIATLAHKGQIDKAGLKLSNNSIFGNQCTLIHTTSLPLDVGVLFPRRATLVEGF